MKKGLVIAALLMASSLSMQVWAQCVPDTITYPSAGIYPLPSSPLPNGSVGVPYTQVLTVNVPSDTTINLSSIIGFPVPPVTVTIVQQTIGVVNGLPMGIFAANTPPSGIIPGGGHGCIDISGTPTTSGQYVFNIPTDLTFDVPQSVPIIGGTQQTIPGQVPYNLEITGASAVNPATTNGLVVAQSLPNPTSGMTVVRYTVSSICDVQLSVVGIDGKVVFQAVQRNVVGDHSFHFDAKHLAPGLYLYRLSDGQRSVVQKMVVE